MIKIFILSFLLFLSCGGGSSDASERFFYVDSASGNDSNSGDSESNAWKSISRVNSQELQPGDTVMFKRGQSYDGALELTSSGTDSNPINFDAYGSGSIPVFSGSKIESGWTNHSGNIYKKTMTYTPGKTGSGIVLEDGVPLEFRSWNTNAETSLGSEGHGIRIKADTDAGSISGVSISRSTIQNCESSGIYIGGEAGTVNISRCKISGNKYGIQCAGLSGVTSLKLILKSSLIINQNASGARGIAYNVATGSNFEIINNTFCNNTISFFIGSCAAGTKILKNNVFYSSNSSHTYLYCGSNPAIQSDYNCFYENG